MPVAQSLAALLRAAVPKIAAIAGPAAGKWLTKQKNREALMDALKRSASRLPKERARARIDTTILLLEGIIESAKDPEQIRYAEQAIVRARRLLVKLDLPLSTRAERRANVKDVTNSLERLHAELKDQLDDPGKPFPSTD